VEFLDGDNAVGRYAYFYAGPGSLVNEDACLSDLGKLYIGSVHIWKAKIELWISLTRR
jgi:hypothetical protein